MRPHRLRSRGSRDHGDQRSIRSRGSSRGSVLIEQFSGSDSASGSSLPRTTSVQLSDGDLETSSKSRSVRDLLSRIAVGISRSLVKSNVRRFLDDLAKPEGPNELSKVGRQRRQLAAAGLIKIVREVPDGEDTVAQRFIKSASRLKRGTLALLRLSDDELLRYQEKAISPVAKPVAFMTLLDVVLKRVNSSSFFETIITNAMRRGSGGTAALLYLATQETDMFFNNVDDQILLRFCKRVITAASPLSAEWCCVANLFVFLLVRRPSMPSGPGIELNLADILAEICRHGVAKAAEELAEGRPEDSRRYFVTDGFPLLHLLAVCCDRIELYNLWNTLPLPKHLGPFVVRIVDLTSQSNGKVHDVNSGYAISITLTLLERNKVVSSIPEAKLPKLCSTLVDMVLYGRGFEIKADDIFAKANAKGLSRSRRFTN
ncbi:hypothetical protein FRB90_007926 [Tulasnella sp. 427]|nr:hypothetical protein FRB90_007926 [Tulasnella sp. 427]